MLSAARHEGYTLGLSEYGIQSGSAKDLGPWNLEPLILLFVGLFEYVKSSLESMNAVTEGVYATWTIRSIVD